MVELIITHLACSSRRHPHSRSRKRFIVAYQSMHKVHGEQA